MFTFLHYFPLSVFFEAIWGKNRVLFTNNGEIRFARGMTSHSGEQQNFKDVFLETPKLGTTKVREVNYWT